MSQIPRDIVLGFVAEATAYIPAIEAGFAEFRADRARADALEEPHRCVHTIKGASAMVGLSELSHIAFHLEEVVELLLHEPDHATPDLFAGMETTVGYIKRYLEGVEAGADTQPELAAEATRHVRRLRGLPDEEPAGATEPEPRPEALPEPEFSTPDLELPDFDAPAPPSRAARGDDIPLPDDFFSALRAEPKPAPAPEERTPAAPELLEVFRIESEEHLRVLATLLPEARTDPTNKDRWDAIRRAAHTLKGTAGLVGFDQVTQLAHRMEDLLDCYHDTDRVATLEEVDLLLAGADLIAEAVEGKSRAEQFVEVQARLTALLGPSADETAEEPQEVAEETETAPAVPEVAPAVAAPARVPAPVREEVGGYVRVPIGRLDDVAKLVGELVIARTALEQKVAHLARLLGESRPAAERLGRVSNRLEVGYEASALAGSRTGTAEGFLAAGGGADDGFDDLEFDRYTEFHLLTRELAETTTDVQTVFGEFGHLLGEVDGELARQARLASQVEDKLMQLRMVPLETVLTKLHRTVRTAASAAQKRAELVVEGERTGLDKTVLEALGDPLLHLLRNAVDHGLEAPEVRQAFGKPATGTVTLKAAHEGSHVVLVLSDDGRGIDHQAVRAAIVARGLATQEAVAALGDEEVAEYLFRPGFSTRDEVSELSGRGIGLDVVKTRIEALKGTVTVASAAGRGTTFTIRLPMTLAVVRALLVRAGGQTYAIPLEAVEQILRPGEEDLDRVGRDPVLRAGGALYPLVPLVRVLGGRGGESGEGRPPVVLLRAAGKRVALQIDQLLGGREVVIKSLGRPHKRLFGVSGATLLGDGSVVLILNPAELVRGSGGQTRVHQPVRSAQPARPREGVRVLIVDDSPSVRRVLTMLLTGAGWQVSAAKDGLEALELLNRGDLPDVLLTDVEMPRMDGYELLATVRREAALEHLPVAVLTSRSADKHRRKALDLGASAYVVKPYQDRNLLDILRQLARAGRPVATA